MNYSNGDTVKLKQQALMNDALVPARFVKTGDFPNRFVVARVQKVQLEDGKIVDAISLEECCGKIKDLESNVPLCDSHPADLFELVKRRDALDLEGLKPERETVVHTPLGQLLQIAYVKRDGNSNVLVLKTPLGPLAVTGPWADMGAELLKKHNIL